MKLWTIWIQADEVTWLESAWDDAMTAENRSGYEEALANAEKTAESSDGLMRVVCIEVPDEAIFGAFEIPVAKGTVTSP